MYKTKKKKNTDVIICENIYREPIKYTDMYRNYRIRMLEDWREEE